MFLISVSLIIKSYHWFQLIFSVIILSNTNQDYTEDYIQTGPGQLYALSTRMFSIDRESVPYSWNHTISYDPSKGKMPYLVEMLHATAISALYHPLEEVLEYSIQASISKGEWAKGRRRNDFVFCKCRRNVTFLFVILLLYKFCHICN